MFRGIHDMTSMRRRALAGSRPWCCARWRRRRWRSPAPTNLGTFKGWTAWQGQDDYGKICFVSASPDKSDPTQVNGKPIVRDPPHFLIIHRDKAPAVNPDGTAAKDKSGNPVFRKVRNEVQTLIGYPLQPTTDSFVPHRGDRRQIWNMKSIPDDPATPIKDNEAAWLASMSDEAGFVTALKVGSSLVVNGTSIRGTKTADTYSLAGITAAMRGDRQGLPVTRTPGRPRPLRLGTPLHSPRLSACASDPPPARPARLRIARRARHSRYNRSARSRTGRPIRPRRARAPSVLPWASRATCRRSPTATHRPISI